MIYRVSRLLYVFSFSFSAMCGYGWLIEGLDGGVALGEDAVGVIEGSVDSNAKILDDVRVRTKLL